MSSMRTNSCLSCFISHGEDVYIICNCYLEEDLELMGSDRIYTALHTYGHMVCLCQLFTSSGFTWLKAIFPEDDSSGSYH